MSRSGQGLLADDAGRPGVDDLQLSDAQTPQLGPRRQAVLRALRQSPEGLAVVDVAARTTLHPNTARFHLDALATHGLAVRAVETRTSPGRPRVLYAARAESLDQRSYGLLAEMLAGLAEATDDARAAAVATGRAWGQRLAERPSPGEELDADRAVDALRRIFEDIGFQPEASTTGETVSLLLHHCPFREVATRHPEVVCGVHLGIMHGVLEQLGGAATTESLEPFVTPHVCVAKVRGVSVP